MRDFMHGLLQASVHGLARLADRLRGVALLLLGAGMACTPGGGVTGYDPLVFPSEARLGSTAAILVDANYIALADDWEHYGLHKDNVRIFLEDASSTRVEANVRQVFDLGAAKWSRYAQTHAGAWMTVALFDLPESGLTVPGTATVIVEIAGVEDAERQGTIELTGTGGAPTDIVFPSEGQTAESLLESEPILRLRAVRADAGNPGFEDGWTIGGIEFDLEYFACLQNARVFPDSNASGATSILGPVEEGEPFHQRTHVVLVDPEGFQLAQPNNYLGGSSPTSAGQGPFVSIAFDRGTAITCAGVTAAQFKIENLHVTDVDGETLIDPAVLGAGDATDLVDVIVVDTEASS